MSAFAFRKRLLGSQDDSSSSETSPTPATAVTIEEPSVQAGHSPKKSTPRQKRARKDGPRIAPQHASVELVLPSEEPVSVLATAQSLGLPDPDAVSTPPLEATPAVTPNRSPAVFFSTYTPSKANYRRHKDGTTVITLCENEVSKPRICLTRLITDIMIASCPARQLWYAAAVRKDHDQWCDFDAAVGCHMG